MPDSTNLTVYPRILNQPSQVATANAADRPVSPTVHWLRDVRRQGIARAAPQCDGLLRLIQETTILGRLAFVHAFAT